MHYFLKKYYSEYMAKKTTDNKNNFILALAFLNFLGLLILAIAMLYLRDATQKIATAQTINQTPTITNASYTCSDNKTIQALFFDEKAEITLSDGRELLLFTAMAASGVRYTNSDESITFWTKGNTAFIEEGPTDAVTYADCNQTTQ